MVQIKVVGGFIQKPGIRCLGQHCGNGYSLAFTARECVHQPITEMAHIQLFQSASRKTFIGSGLHLPG